MILIHLIGFAIAAQDIPDRIPVGTARFGAWQVEAETEVDRQQVEGADRPLPVVREVRCRATTRNMWVGTDRRGRFAIYFTGDGDDDETNFGLTEVRSLRLDGVDYQSRAVQTLSFPWRFLDVVYPDREDRVTPIFGGYLAVRRRPNHPWVDLATLLDELMAGRSLRLGFGQQIDNRVGPLTYRTVSLHGLREALLWCERQLGSDRAYRLHPG